MAIINLYENFQKGKRYYNDSLMESFGESTGYFRGEVVFISHRSKDKCTARDIAKKLENKGYTVYLDENDCFLRMAVEQNNGKEIVKAIREAIENSHHLLCLISDETRDSWWVPYEVGIADSNNKNIVSYKTPRYSDDWIPEFLKINKVVKNEEELDKHFGRVGLVRYMDSLLG